MLDDGGWFSSNEDGAVVVMIIDLHLYNFYFLIWSFQFFPYYLWYCQTNRIMRKMIINYRWLESLFIRDITFLYFSSFDFFPFRHLFFYIFPFLHFSILHFSYSILFFDIFPSIFFLSVKLRPTEARQRDISSTVIERNNNGYQERKVHSCEKEKCTCYTSKRCSQ